MPRSWHCEPVKTVKTSQTISERFSKVDLRLTRQRWLPSFIRWSHAGNHRMDRTVSPERNLSQWLAADSLTKSNHNPSSRIQRHAAPDPTRPRRRGGPFSATVGRRSRPSPRNGLPWECGNACCRAIGFRRWQRESPVGRGCGRRNPFWRIADRIHSRVKVPRVWRWARRGMRRCRVAAHCRHRRTRCRFGNFFPRSRRVAGAPWCRSR